MYKKCLFAPVFVILPGGVEVSTDRFGDIWGLIFSEKFAGLENYPVRQKLAGVGVLFENANFSVAKSTARLRRRDSQSRKTIAVWENNPVECRTSGQGSLQLFILQGFNKITPRWQPKSSTERIVVTEFRQSPENHRAKLG